MNRALVFLATLALVFFAGCVERGDKAIARGKGLGQDWRVPAGEKQMRISADNSFTRDVYVVAEGAGKHYELKVGPIREGYMIIPEAKYAITAYTEERSTGINKLYVIDDDRNGSRGILVKIRF